MSAQLRITESVDQFEKLPPHSIEAEKSLIASMLLDRAAIDIAQERIGDSSPFYLPEHGILYGVVVDLHNADRPVDAVIVRAELEKRNLLESIGGTAYLAEMLHFVPSAANVDHYLNVVMDRYGWRELISTANEALRTAWNRAGGIDYEEAAAQLAMRAECIRDTGGADPTVSIYQAVSESVESMRGQKPRRLLTGLNECDPDFRSAESDNSFDKVSGGFPFRQTTIIGGRPGSGKSAFAKSVLLNFAKQGWRVGIVTIEEDRVKIGDNALAHETDVQNWKIQRAVVTDPEHKQLKQAAEKFKGLNFFIDDTCTTLTQVEASLRRLKRKYGCQVLVVDHLHLIQHDSGRRNESRNDQITVISGRIKAMFRRLDVAGIVVCQLNRSGEGIDNPPGLTSLREGGALEQDGDLIVLLHRRDYYRTKDEPKDCLLEINVAKNKAGGTGIAYAYWTGDHQSVGDWNGGRGPRPPVTQEDLDMF